jgi:Ca-activated chloride channel family protein
MNVRWNGQQTRIEAAKELLSQSIDSLRSIPNLEIALRVYGHQSPITATFQDCNDTKLEVGFGTNNIDAIKSKIRSIEAKGTTPIARSLEAAAQDFPDSVSRNYIILITDGLEACDNDPCVVAKKLKDKGVKVTPFVIGLGMDLSYLEKFNCIGTYADAETKESFKTVLKNVVSKTLLNTTVQINLNTITKQPKETDVSMFLYAAGTKELKYTFVHTLNNKGNPDTLVIDPALKYDLIVHTIPPVEKKNIPIQRHTHNTIEVDAPQGNLAVKHLNATRTYLLDTRVMQFDKEKTINVQKLNSTDKYIVGKYDIEILSLPRIYRTIDINQSSTTTLEIPAPGVLAYSSLNKSVVQLFVKAEDGAWNWVINLPEENRKGNLQLQPGTYKLVFRLKNARSSLLTQQNEFTIYSNKTTTIAY